MKKAIISLIFLLSFAVAAIAATSSPELRADAPERYTVVPGDTLWGIATRFLRDPWRWPELWKMNRDADPQSPSHLSRATCSCSIAAGGQVRMRLETTRVGPRIRIEPREADAIQTIPPSVIEPFLSKPLVVSANELDAAPQIVATRGRPRRSRTAAMSLTCAAWRSPARRAGRSSAAATRWSIPTASNCSATSASISARPSSGAAAS